MLGSQGCLRSTSSGQLVQVGSGPLLFPPKDSGALEALKAMLLAEVKTLDPVSRAEPKKWPSLVRLDLGQRRDRNTVSMGRKGGRENEEVGRWGTCAGTGWRGWDCCEGTQSGSRWSLQHNGNRKEPHSPPSLLLPGGPQDPLPKGWNANPNTKRAW